MLSVLLHVLGLRMGRACEGLATRLLVPSYNQPATSLTHLQERFDESYAPYIVEWMHLHVTYTQWVAVETGAKSGRDVKVSMSLSLTPPLTAHHPLIIITLLSVCFFHSSSLTLFYDVNILSLTLPL